MQYTLVSVDAWTDGEDGWTWNDTRVLGTFDLREPPTEDELWNVLTGGGYLRGIAERKELEIEDANGMCETFEVRLMRTGEPLFAFILEAT